MSDEIDAWGLPVWPAPERNKEVILRAILPRLPDLAPSGDADALFLEIGAGTGQHMQHFFPEVAAYFEGVQGRIAYQPTDVEPQHLETLSQRVEHLNFSGLKTPLKLDAAAASWPVDSACTIFNANTIHISPFEVTIGLFAGVGRILEKAGVFFLYGPFSFGGSFTSESNEEFDERLKSRDSRWGVRDLQQLLPLAQKSGLELVEQISLPAHNHLLVWKRSSP